MAPLSSEADSIKHLITWCGLSTMVSPLTLFSSLGGMSPWRDCLYFSSDYSYTVLLSIWILLSVFHLSFNCSHNLHFSLCHGAVEDIQHFVCNCPALQQVYDMSWVVESSLNLLPHVLGIQLSSDVSTQQSILLFLAALRHKHQSLPSSPYQLIIAYWFLPYRVLFSTEEEAKRRGVYIIILLYVRSRFYNCTLHTTLSNASSVAAASAAAHDNTMLIGTHLL